MEDKVEIRVFECIDTYPGSLNIGDTVEAEIFSPDEDYEYYFKDYETSFVEYFPKEYVENCPRFFKEVERYVEYWDEVNEEYVKILKEI